MNPKIRVLSDLTINQIAAGEVIENPASVVKELVENAIDAGAAHVKIEVLGGGFQLIKISDNGSGMAPDDAVLCLERHATSKIAHAEDLFALQTMGFRGEALASVAAISKMRLLTALENAPATDVEIEGGKITHIGPAARSRGTTIEVRSLFFNVPARKKFQKSPVASSAEITKIVTQLALSHPEIGFDLIQQNRSLFSLPPSSLLRERAHALLGQEFVSSCRDFQFKDREYEGHGLVADPLFSRHNRSGQYLFVNRRPVVCPSIAYAVRDAYGTRLNSDKHPVYLLHFSIPPSLVDVNVHPQKKEIRLREESLLKYALHSAVNAALASLPTEPSLMETPAFSSPFTQVPYADFSQALTFKEEREDPLSQELPLEHPMHLIGVHGRYLLIDAQTLSPFNTSGVVWVDLPAAEARIQFDALMNHAENNPLSQGLLLPLSFSFAKAEAQLLKTHLPTLHKLGLQVREVAESAFIIDGIPPFLNEAEIQPLLLEMIGELQELTRSETTLRRLAATLSRTSRFRRHFYSQEEARLIAEQLMKTSDPLHCPQGKKTLFHITEDQLESYFTAK